MITKDYGGKKLEDVIQKKLNQHSERQLCASVVLSLITLCSPWGKTSHMGSLAHILLDDNKVVEKLQAQGRKTRLDKDIFTMNKNVVM